MLFMKKDPLLPLKFAVYGMGVMLLGGFLWLGGKLAMKANDLHSADCKNITITLPAEVQAEHMTLSGDDWVVRGSDDVFYRFDRCGREVQRAKIISL
jgi:hypothetical protein